MDMAAQKNLRLVVFLALTFISGCATTAGDVGRGMQVGAASKFDNPIAPIIWVSGIAIEKMGAINSEPSKSVRELSPEEQDEKNCKLELARKKSDLDAKFRSGLSLKTPFRPYVAEFCSQHPEIDRCAKEYLEIAKVHLALLAELEDEKIVESAKK